MVEKEAFSYVYEKLRAIPMFSGRFDAKNGSKPFMYGIESVMEFIAFKADQQEEFEKDWTENFEKSIDKVAE